MGLGEKGQILLSESLSAVRLLSQLSSRWLKQRGALGDRHLFPFRTHGLPETSLSSGHSF